MRKTKSLGWTAVHRKPVTPRTRSGHEARRNGLRTSFVIEASQIEFLDRISVMVRITSGRRLTKRAVIETLVSLLPIARISVEHFASGPDLERMLCGPTQKVGRGSGALSPLASARMWRILNTALDQPRKSGGSTTRRTISLQLDRQTLATLQLVSASIRRDCGIAFGMSAIVRSLLKWLAEAEIEFMSICTAKDLRKRLLAVLNSPDLAERSGGG